MKKKIAVILMACAISLSACACNKSDETKKTRKTKTTKTEQTEEVDEEDLFLNCFWKQSSRGKGVSFRFYEDGTGYFASWENEDDEKNMGYEASTFEYKLKKDNKLTITCEDNEEIAGKYDISFDDRGNLILENDDVTYNLRKQEFDIEEEDFDMDQIFGDKWEYIDGGEVLEQFEFYEDGTGTFSSGGGEKANAYFTDITWTIKGNLLSVTRRGDWTDEYVISLENRDTMKLTDTKNGMSTYYIRNTLPVETTEEPTTTTEEPSTTTTEEPTTTTTAEPTTTTTVASTDTTTPTPSTNPDDYSSYDTRNLRNPNAVMAFQGLMETNQYMFIDYNILTEDPDMEGTFNTHVEGCVFTRNEDNDPALYAYLEFPFDYDFNAENLKLFKEAMSSGTTTTFTENGNFLIFEDSTWNTYGILDMQNRWCFMSELGEDDAFSKYAELAEMFGFEID